MDVYFLSKIRWVFSEIYEFYYVYNGHKYVEMIQMLWFVFQLVESFAELSILKNEISLKQGSF